MGGKAFSGRFVIDFLLFTILLLLFFIRALEFKEKLFIYEV